MLPTLCALLAHKNRNVLLTLVQMLNTNLNWVLVRLILNKELDNLLRNNPNKYNRYKLMNRNKIDIGIDGIIRSRSVVELIRISYRFYTMDKWIGKIAVVTGASAGIGSAIVQDLAKAGIHVVGLARRDEKIEELAQKLGETPGKIYARKCDVSDMESVNAAFQWIEEKFGSINIVINNAGILYNGNILDTGENVMEQLSVVMNTNFTGAVQCSREGVRLMEKSSDYGLVININSVCGNYVPFGLGLNVYSSAKHALRAFTDTLRHELVTKGSSKIRVSNVSPGVVETEIMVTAGMVSDASQVYDNIPNLSPENISEAVMFLMQLPHDVNITQLTIQPVGDKI